MSAPVSIRPPTKVAAPVTVRQYMAAVQPVIARGARATAYVAPLVQKVAESQDPVSEAKAVIQQETGVDVSGTVTVLKQLWNGELF